MQNSLEQGSSIKSPIATPIQVVWFLAVLIFLVNYTFEVLAFNHLYVAQSFLLLLLQSILSIWAIIELVITSQRYTAIPLGGLIFTLLAQLIIGAMRYPIGQFVDANRIYGDTIANNLEFGLATIFIPVYLIFFMIISKMVINAFSFLDRQRAELLETEIGFRIQAEEAAKWANNALKIANAELNQLATTDPLTNVWNRRYFKDKLIVEIAKSKRYKTPISLLILDVDHFKSINDNHGHSVGDKVLIELSKLLQSEIRETDVLARWGGEEFVVMMAHIGASDALILAEKLRLLVAEHAFAHVGTITLSIGAAEFKAGESMDDWLKRGDLALYEAKDGGRNMVRVAG